MKNRIFVAFVAASVVGSAFGQMTFPDNAEKKINIKEYRNFISRRDVKEFPAHGITFTKSGFYLIKGTRQDGGCRFEQILEAESKDISGNIHYGAVDLAVDEATCEKITEKGFYIDTAIKNKRSSVQETWKSIQSTSTSNITTRGADGHSVQMSTSKAAPIDAQVLSTSPLYSPLCPAQPYPSEPAKPGYVTGGVYTQWDDSNNPVFRNNNICITTNWSQTEIQYKPGICQETLNNNQTSYEMYSWHKFFWRASTGWRPDLSYNNSYNIKGYCNAYKYGNNPWVVTSEEYQANTWLKFMNPGLLGFALDRNGFPTCATAVYTTYEPNGIRVTGTGRVTAKVVTFWSGQKTFCGEWLRSFSKLVTS